MPNASYKRISNPSTPKPNSELAETGFGSSLVSSILVSLGLRPTETFRDADCLERRIRDNKGIQMRELVVIYGQSSFPETPARSAFLPLLSPAC